MRINREVNSTTRISGSGRLYEVSLLDGCQECRVVINKMSLPVIAAALVVALLPADAQPAPPLQMRPDILPPAHILTRARAMGFSPTDMPTRRGDYYVLQAVNSHGVQVRVVADALFGDLLTITPVRAQADILQYESGNSINHIPLPREHPHAAVRREDLLKTARAQASENEIVPPSIRQRIDSAPPKELRLPRADPRRAHIPPPIAQKRAEIPLVSSEPKRTVLSVAPLPTIHTSSIKPRSRESDNTPSSKNSSAVPQVADHPWRSAVMLFAPILAGFAGFAVLTVCRRRKNGFVYKKSNDMDGLSNPHNSAFVFAKAYLMQLNEIGVAIKTSIVWLVKTGAICSGLRRYVTHSRKAGVSTA